MKFFGFLLCCLYSVASFGQSTEAPNSTKAILLQQLKESQDDAQWFVPLGNAVKDLTPAQAMWKPDDSSHSI
ncbi:MAG TPA: hypothetical protein VK666_19640, partial [Chryseolinea sp.]|nr:hypothetical protein [Chryseolinea sp.]